MATRKSGARGQRSASKSAVSRKSATRRSRPASAQPAASSQSGSVIMQARVAEDFARILLEQDAAVLGLDGPSALVREGLRLVHERARDAAMAASYDDFYAGDPAPLPPGVAPASAG